MDEGDKLSAEGRQINIDKVTQQLPVHMKNQRYEETEEEGQVRARRYANQRESQLEAQRSIILKTPGTTSQRTGHNHMARQKG